ncbi:LOW QUALITY PROTEIN: extracellular calcium-sensing receptor-like [Morone saxatilis]|uniref:LOW QUALITY PROTEIN: extracellular calcium-sensing receptor-like n=1 Tax=Morone saxatilis TaxID=34816 RepID=UPI0015E24516|nr:LOW QUALITY PROTEIN: extracellular calcium-sensing receptor-like [Morone saxatilis]
MTSSAHSPLTLSRVSDENGVNLIQREEKIQASVLSSWSPSQGLERTSHGTIDWGNHSTLSILSASQPTKSNQEVLTRPGQALGCWSAESTWLLVEEKASPRHKCVPCLEIAEGSQSPPAPPATPVTHPERKTPQSQQAVIDVAARPLSAGAPLFNFRGIQYAQAMLFAIEEINNSTDLLPALAQLVKHFGWTWVGAIRTNDDYGNNGMATFTETAQQLGICLEYSVSFFRTDPPEKVQKIIDIIKASTSKVIVTFLSHMDIDILIHEMSLHNLTGYQWVGTEAWIFDFQTAAMDRHHILDGAIGLFIPKAHVSGMREFILDVKSLNSSSNELFTEFWETLFSCKFKQSKSSAENQRECTGDEDLIGVQNSYTDMSLMPIFYNVYKGVYAVAHALHNILSCNKTCNRKVQLDPFMILQHIKKIKFKTKEGDEVYFNEYGDPAAKYEIINWQPTENGIVDFVTVGLYDASLPADKQLNLQNKSLIWAQNSQQVPVSVCSEKCRPGTRKVLQKGKPICCYDCIRCAEGEISNITDSITCVRCDPEFWSNERRDACVNKEAEFLSYEEIMGALLTAASLFGTCMTAVVAFIFFRYRKTPIVRANNSELSFLLLFSLGVLRIPSPPAYRLLSLRERHYQKQLFAILASSFGLLICIFIPKCYIILVKPEKNTKRNMMGKGTPKSL